SSPCLLRMRPHFPTIHLSCISHYSYSFLFLYSSPQHHVLHSFPTRRSSDLYDARGLTESYWLGTDQFGRDIWTRVWAGTRISLYIAFLAATLDLVIGVVYGGNSAFYGGRVDHTMQRIIEVLVGIPDLMFIVLL